MQVQSCLHLIFKSFLFYELKKVFIIKKKQCIILKIKALFGVFMENSIVLLKRKVSW